MMMSHVWLWPYCTNFLTPNYNISGDPGDIYDPDAQSSNLRVQLEQDQNNKNNQT